MLWVSTDILKLALFREKFQSSFSSTFLDLSKVPSCDLAAESSSIVDHHSDCCVFLGYLEPGFMLDNPSQTILRKLFRKFPVAIVCNYIESLPFSWKNEIEFLFTPQLPNGPSYSIDDGSSLQYEPKI